MKAKRLRNRRVKTPPRDAVPVPGFPRYFVRRDGSVYGPNGKKNPKRPRVTLHNGKKRANRWVHHLVLEAFVGPRPEGKEACHLDGDPTNNAAENLHWDTHFNNMLDRSLPVQYDGRLPRAAIIDIHARLHCDGEDPGAIAYEFWIPRRTVFQIRDEAEPFAFLSCVAEAAGF